MGLWISKPPPGILINWAHPLAQGLMGFWLFNEGGGIGINNLAGVNARPTLTGTTDWRGGGLSLAGSTSYLYSPYPKMTTAGTIECLVSFNTTANQRPVMLGANDFWVGVDVGVLKGRVYDGAGNRTITGSAPTVGRRYHLVATFDSSNLRFYVDGVLIGSTSAAAINYEGTAGDTYIGGTTSFYLDGILHKAAMYNRALSAAEVALLSAQPYAMMRSPSWATRFNSTANAPKRLLMMGVG